MIHLSLVIEEEQAAVRPGIAALLEEVSFPCHFPVQIMQRQKKVILYILRFAVFNPHLTQIILPSLLPCFLPRGMFFLLPSMEVFAPEERLLRDPGYFSNHLFPQQGCFSKLLKEGAM